MATSATGTTTKPAASTATLPTTKPASVPGASAHDDDLDDSDPSVHPYADMANKLWQAFAAATKLTDLKPTDDGACALRLDDMRMVVWCRDDEPALTIQAHIMDLPEAQPQRGQMCEVALTQGLYLPDGDCVGYDTEKLVYQRTVKLKDLNPDELLKVLWDIHGAALDIKQAMMPK